LKGNKKVPSFELEVVVFKALSIQMLSETGFVFFMVRRKKLMIIFQCLTISVSSLYLPSRYLQQSRFILHVLNLFGIVC
jgi:hypothetical protein